MINNPWIQWMQSMQAPFSNYDQNISPVTTWFSPTYEVNYKGNPAIEAKITREVASFGKQLGLLSDAVLEIADGNPGEAISKLRDLTNQIEAIKQEHKDTGPTQLAASLKHLKANDKAAFDKLMKELESD